MTPAQVLMKRGCCPKNLRGLGFRLAGFVLLGPRTTLNHAVLAEHVFGHGVKRGFRAVIGSPSSRLQTCTRELKNIR